MASSLALKKLVPYTLRRPNTIRRPFIIDRGYRHDCYLSDRDERKWDKRETEDSLFIHMDMPGLGKEDVKVVVEQNIDLIVKGETKGSIAKGQWSKIYQCNLSPKKLYKTDQIKAEMKNGVLKVVVPKLKEEERSEVFHVKVE